MELTGCRYVGDRKRWRMEGKGRFEFPDGIVYEGEMKDGTMHGKGVLRFPNGARMEGDWEHGRNVSRKYIFRDGLQYEEKDWPYCTPQDRRFHSEILHALKPAGQIHPGPDPRISIPAGCYDVGDGFLDERTGTVFNYDGEPLRTADAEEMAWARAKCRKA